MKIAGILWTVLPILFMAAAVLAQSPQVRVTVYNNNLALVHETRRMDLPKPTGLCSYRDVAAYIDPTSVHFKSVSNPEAVRVLEQNFEYDLVSADKILQRYLDQNVRLMSKQGNPIEGKLLSAGGYILNKSHFMPPWGHTLANGDIRKLVAYVRALCQCEGPLWARDGE